MSTARKFTREECARAEAEAYLRKLRERIAYRQGITSGPRKALSARTEDAKKQSGPFLELVSERTQAKAALEARVDKSWRWQTQMLRKQAEAYKRWLRRFILPKEEEETTTDPLPSETSDRSPRMTLVQKPAERGDDRSGVALIADGTGVAHAGISQSR